MICFLCVKVWLELLKPLAKQIKRELKHKSGCVSKMYVISDGSVEGEPAGLY